MSTLRLTPAWLARGVLLALLTLLVASCGEEPKTPPRLVSFFPAIPSVEAGGNLTVRIDYDEGGYKLDDFVWTAEAGDIEGNGQPEITYRAPPEAGSYKLTVTVAYGEGESAAEASLDTVVKVSAPPAAVAGTTTEETASGEQAEAEAQATEAPAASSEEAAPPTEEAAPSEQARTEPQPVETPAARAEPAASSTAEPAPSEQAAAEPQPAEEPAATTEEVAAPTEEAAPTEQAAAEAQPAEKPAAGGQEKAAPAAAVAALGAQPGAEKPPSPAGAAAAPSRIDDILARGRMTAVVQIDFKPFSFYGPDGRRVGFDVDLARDFARRWLGDPLAITFLPVPTDKRIPMIVEGKADIAVAALTDTPARRQQIDFSITYFKDGQRLLVPENSTVSDVCDLKDKKVAAIAGSTSIENLKAAASACGFDVEPSLVAFRRHRDAIDALLAGEVDAFTSDGLALENYAEGQPLKVVGNHFSEEPYGVGLPKGDERFRHLIDKTLVEMQADGTLAALYKKWFGDTIAPYPLDVAAVAAEPEEPEVAELTTSEAPAVVEPVTTPTAMVEEYVVQSGDTLSKIAGKVYGDVSPGSWQRIYEANKDLIGPDPSKIEVGMKLKIPAA